MADTVNREETLAAAREFLSKLKAQDESVFWQVLAPYVAEGIQIADVLTAITGCREAILQGNLEDALAFLRGILKWHQELTQRAELDRLPQVTRSVH